MIEGFAAAASQYQQGRIQYDYQMRVAKLSLDTMKDSGQAMVKMLDELPVARVSSTSVDVYA
ncbi:YjfB family protein [Desulfurispirillum indicum]|uniref:Motility protein n=1 Tax=Desulfurispirillum indicum (strain ATCC BAA-1389 / DSM 22839 / S5) TaxID=653733 RepID=E6W1U3_DESIS|nr:YjfB family protein [Desulfurispirillum indicum]ADU65475.1 hypothetical protein Selin_0731 [Desulfurispirillum indicum S5]UCZ57395.1 YjfB family protein [Desulfurispirillum indicum]